MNDRIIELSRCQAHVSVDNGLLTLDIKGEDRVQVPAAEVAAVVAAHYAVTFTREAVALLADNGAQVVVCDKRGMPAAMLLPLRGFHQPASRLALQAATKQPVRKRLWRQVVRSKVRAQGALLLKLRGDDAGLPAMAADVKSGDGGNVEGLAARIYWRRLFGEDFRRDSDGFDHNRFLNYGYGVLRAVTCRAICSAGLHPGLGLHHHHRANPFCLADDLMEPFRPLVDEIVFRLWTEQLAMAELTPPLKKRLLEVLMVRLTVGGEERGLFAMFDLPVKTRQQRREYTRFRKLLLREGFSQLQFSVYARYCVSEEVSTAQSDRVRVFLPPEGQVRMLGVTERQFGKQRIFWGPKQKPPEPAPVQLMLF